MLSFEGGTLLLREEVTMLRSRDVIHSGPALFWYIIHVPVLVIIPVLKKKTLRFDSPSYIYIYIYIYICVCVCVCANQDFMAFVAVPLLLISLFFSNSLKLWKAVFTGDKARFSVDINSLYSPLLRQISKMNSFFSEINLNYMTRW